MKGKEGRKVIELDKTDADDSLSQRRNVSSLEICALVGPQTSVAENERCFYFSKKGSCAFPFLVMEEVEQYTMINR